MHFFSFWRDGDDETAPIRIIWPAGSEEIVGPLASLASSRLESLLPARCTAELTQSVQRHQRCRILLEPSLPAAWQDYPWEELSFAGRSLGHQVLVVRHARARFSDGLGRTQRMARYLDCFPRHEHDFPRDLAELVERGLLRPCQTRDLAGVVDAGTDLFVLAHGDSRGLLDRRGQPFDLSAMTARPERVWLLACNREHVLHGLAQRLLSQGVRTVILATADLSALQMSGVVRSWLNSRKADPDPAAWLAAHKGGANLDGGPQSLTVFGETLLDEGGPCTFWNSLSWAMEHGLDPRVPLGDHTTSDEFHAADRCLDADGTWELTRHWMLPLLLWQAEKHDHRRMRQLEARLGDTESPQGLRGLAAAARRFGHYPPMARYLAQALSLRGLSDTDKVWHLGALANLLIDLDLPKTAMQVVELHEDCLIDDPVTRQRNDYRRLDWRARINARRGRFDVALDEMGAKRRLAADDASRELAWLVYLGAWRQVAGLDCSVEAQGLADAARDRLAKANRARLGHGNEPAAYLLRAVAAQAWATRDPAGIDQVLDWKGEAEQRLTCGDPGPWAYTLAYIHLALGTERALFERAMAALENARYYLEAAVFFALAGGHVEQARLLDRFQTRRANTLEQLTHESLKSSLVNLADETAARRRIERATVADVHRPACAADIARAGILPL